jgi:hypothetical protein
VQDSAEVTRLRGEVDQIEGALAFHEGRLRSLAGAHRRGCMFSPRRLRRMARHEIARAVLRERVEIARAVLAAEIERAVADTGTKGVSRFFARRELAA